MTARRVVVVTAGLSTPSSTRLLADRLAASAVRSLREQGHQATVETVELRDHARDLADRMLTGFASPGLAEVVDGIADADGVIAVTPIFNASYSGLFKTFFDAVEPDALTDTPVLIAATGGTARHSLALEHAVRPLFGYLRSVVAPTAVFAAAEDWGSGGDGRLGVRIDRAADQFAALVGSRSRAEPRDPFDDPVPFATLLSGE
ncbi:FMN reductase [Nocardiopsis ansamitocini]|uniref:Oxidoreductase n=1 Tax=Nocardiopsis ansamitocini TaxID=1670832 RepID=A0A9W6P249_9ACTN|nr:FMN reductase [Nocardiopsis ansamitocini]GLU45729.1 oxidoreductase [Nocardiopsis ansamitocini]